MHSPLTIHYADNTESRRLYDRFSAVLLMFPVACMVA